MKINVLMIRGESPVLTMEIFTVSLFLAVKRKGIAETEKAEVVDIPEDELDTIHPHPTRAEICLLPRPRRKFCPPMGEITSLHLPVVATLNILAKAGFLSG